jgi:hypothetical protein
MVDVQTKLLPVYLLLYLLCTFFLSFYTVTIIFSTLLALCHFLTW